MARRTGLIGEIWLDDIYRSYFDCVHPDSLGSHVVIYNLCDFMVFLCRGIDILPVERKLLVIAVDFNVYSAHVFALDACGNHHGFADPLGLYQIRPTGSADHYIRNSDAGSIFFQPFIGSDARRRSP